MRAQVSANAGGAARASGAVLAGVECDGTKYLLDIRLERRPVLAEHEQVGRNAVVVAERRMRPAVAPDVSQLNLGDRQRPVRVPEDFELLRREERLDVKGELPGQPVEQHR